MADDAVGDDIPDVRNGLTREERIIVDCLNKLQQERGGRNVLTSMLYGRVLEYLDMSVDGMQSIVQRICGHK